jgi:hypothetical protein
MKIKIILSSIFGTAPKTVFRRVLILLAVLLLGFILIQNISCKFKVGTFEFQWNQAAEININKEIK